MPTRRRRASRLDDRLLLDLIGDVCGTLDLAELREGMLHALQRVLPSDYASLNDLGPRPQEIVALMTPEADPEMYERWVRHAHENPLLARYLRTLDGRAYRFSDVVTPDELHELALYRELYAPLGVEHQLAFSLPASPERVLAIALSRGARDYSDEERDFVNRARPFLIQAYLNAIAYESQRARGEGNLSESRLDALSAVGLTRREGETLLRLALGKSNNHIATELGISGRTVGKHLENGYRKLGVGDRSSAAGLVWELAGAGIDRSGSVVSDAG
jgi:DNA-binding CsgD family transcriptional regulator